MVYLDLRVPDNPAAIISFYRAELTRAGWKEYSHPNASYYWFSRSKSPNNNSEYQRLDIELHPGNANASCHVLLELRIQHPLDRPGLVIAQFGKTAAESLLMMRCPYPIAQLPAWPGALLVAALF
jgi:hypothetical protein